MAPQSPGVAGLAEPGKSAATLGPLFSGASDPGDINIVAQGFELDPR
jgi:hypothetical protein